MSVTSKKRKSDWAGCCTSIPPGISLRFSIGSRITMRGRAPQRSPYGTTILHLPYSIFHLPSFFPFRFAFPHTAAVVTDAYPGTHLLYTRAWRYIESKTAPDCYLGQDWPSTSRLNASLQVPNICFSMHLCLEKGTRGS
ncbi:hypothetical protein QC761_001064 [Podospora bellae-mahoneyi]|uniref:Uncharacterized protein n=1 Tax=Podospora bellae-mahoneyi TaxID=2093777 RepID=A0ABR0FMZ1_9PEZI|nr:hypothetical protein QC761_001064 [Podospora bellae-mahoneyi]